MTTLVVMLVGYEPVAYGAVLPQLVRDTTQLGPLTLGGAGLLSFCSLLGMLVGAIVIGVMGHRCASRTLVTTSVIVSSIGMGLIAAAPNALTFAILRFVTGIGLGGMVSAAVVIVAEFAPPGRAHLHNAVMCSGIPLGGVLAAGAALVFDDAVGWRGVFLLGALPLILLVPPMVMRLPAAVREVLPYPDGPATAVGEGRKVAARVASSGILSLFSRSRVVETLLLGTMSFIALLLTYGLNTWLPVIMQAHGLQVTVSLFVLLTLNGGAVIGVLLAAVVADRLGPKGVVLTTFLMASAVLFALPRGMPLLVLLVAVSIVGVGTIGTQILIYGLVGHLYSEGVRHAGAAWCAATGRVGGIVGPLLGGAVMGVDASGESALNAFAGLALVGGAMTLMLRTRDSRASTRVP
ncbi:MFS transporter [Mycolicibacterium sp. XJ2546]